MLHLYESNRLEALAIVLAWLVAGLMHFAVGSATVAMISAAGMVLPMLGAHPTVSKEIICIAIGLSATLLMVKDGLL